MKTYSFLSFKWLLFVAFLGCQILTHAQAPAIQWQKCLGGTDGDFAYCISQTSDGGYIVAGGSNSNDGNVTGHHGADTLSDYWIVKLDENGTIQWQKSMGGTDTDVANSISQTSDGGYIAAGYSLSNDGNITGNNHGYDYWIVKMDSSGSIQWQKCLGGTSGDAAYLVSQTSDGGYIVAGNANSNNCDVTGNHGMSDYWIVKLDSSGTIQWQKSLGGTNTDIARAICQTSDGGYIVTGTAFSVDGDVAGSHGGDYWVVKLDSNGTIQWQKALGGTSLDEGNSIAQTTDGGYIVAGYARSNDGDVTGNHGNGDYWIVKLDGSGAILWQKCLGGGNFDKGNYVSQTSDGGYILGGRSWSFDGDVTGNHGFYDYWVVKIDSSGTIQWQKSLGGTSLDEAYSVSQTSDGGYIVVGTVASGNGDVIGNHGANDYWIVKLAAPTAINSNTLSENIALYPNPNTGCFQVSGISPESYPLSISVLDTKGSKIYQQRYETPIKDILIQMAIPKGVYLLEIQNEKGKSYQKFLVE